MFQILVCFNKINQMLKLSYKKTMWGINYNMHQYFRNQENININQVKSCM